MISEPKYECMENKDTVLEMLVQHVEKTPDRTAVICGLDERVSFAELWVLSGRIYAWLKSKEIGAEDIVMFCLPRGTGLYACIIGTMRAGAAFVLTETDNDQKRTDYIRRDCGCNLYVDENDWDEIIHTAPQEGYEDIRLHALCYIAYTSGTTAKPKGILHEYGSLENAWRSVRMNGVPLITNEDTFLAMSPMNFVSLPIIFAMSCAFGNAVAIMPYTYSVSEESLLTRKYVAQSKRFIPSSKSSPAKARPQAGDGSRAAWDGFRSTIPSVYNEEHMILSEPVGIPACGVFTGSFFV